VCHEELLSTPNYLAELKKSLIPMRYQADT